MLYLAYSYQMNHHKRVFFYSGRVRFWDISQVPSSLRPTHRSSPLLHVL